MAAKNVQKELDHESHKCAFDYSQKLSLDRSQSALEQGNDRKWFKYPQQRRKKTKNKSARTSMFDCFEYFRITEQRQSWQI